MERAYPEVCGPGVKVKVEGLAWSADGDGAEVFRVVLLVFGSYFAYFTAGKLLLKYSLHVGFASDELVLAVFALLVHSAAHEVGALHCRLEGILVEEVDVGLGSGTLVLGVVDELDSVEASGSHDCG